MTDPISNQTFLILVISVIVIGLGIIGLSIRSIVSLNKKHGLKRRVLENGRVNFEDETGAVRISIAPKPHQEETPDV